MKGELETKGGIDGVTTYSYDPMGNLSQAVLPNNTVIGYTYDAQGRLIAKRVDGVIEYRLIYSGQLSPVAKVDADGDVLELYISGTGANSPDYIVKAGSVYRVIKDHLGSTRMIVNANTGDIVKDIRYSEFGEIIEETGTFDTIFGFAGGIRDTDTGLTRFGARWYDPETGRWISKEPLGFAGSNNFYAYVDGDPVNAVDSNGLKIVYLGTEADKKKIMMALSKLSMYSPTAAELILHLEFYDEEDKKEVKIQMGTSFGHHNGVVTWSETNNNITEPWEKNVPSEIWLAHELIHALHYLHETWKPWRNTLTNQEQPEEYFTVGLDGSSYPFTENRIRKDYMKYYPELTFRDYYYEGDSEHEKMLFNPIVTD